jgi:hypothetical protein
MWELRHLTTLWASTASYRDSFTFLLFYRVYLVVLMEHTSDDVILLRSCIQNAEECMSALMLNIQRTDNTEDPTYYRTCRFRGSLSGWDVTPSHSLKVNRCLWGTSRSLLATCFVLVYCLTCSSLKMEAIYYSETSDHFHQTTRRYIPAVWHLNRCWRLQLACYIWYWLHTNSVIMCQVSPLSLSPSRVIIIVRRTQLSYYMIRYNLF